MRPVSSLPPGLVDLIEHAAVGEVRLLRLLPAAEDLVDREELHLREACRRTSPRPSRRAGGSGASRRSPGLPASRGTAGRPRPTARVPFLSTTLSTTATGGSARMLSDGTTISTLPFASVERQIRFVLPGQQHVADAALHEGRRRAARAGVEHRHVLVERGDELSRLRVVAAGLPLARSPTPRDSSSARRRTSSGSA